LFIWAIDQWTILTNTAHFLQAGMWEFATGNTFGATALSSYGGFWLSYAVILTPGVSTASSSIRRSFCAHMSKTARQRL